MNRRITLQEVGFVTRLLLLDRGFLVFRISFNIFHTVVRIPNLEDFCGDEGRLEEQL